MLQSLGLPISLTRLDSGLGLEFGMLVLYEAVCPQEIVKGVGKKRGVLGDALDWEQKTSAKK